MNLNQFTIRAREAIEQAAQIAQSSGQQSIETGHLLKDSNTAHHQCPFSAYRQKLSARVGSGSRRTDLSEQRFEPKFSESAELFERI